MSKDYLLDHYQTSLDDLEQDYKKVKEQLRVEQDGPAQNKLERQIEQLGQRMDQLQQKIRQHQEKQQQQKAQSALAALIGLFANHEDELERVIAAYQQTSRRWSVPLRLDVKTVDAIIYELERIVPRQSSYTAREEFIARVYQTANPSLCNALNQWTAQYRPGMDWLQLHSQIQAAQNQRLEKAQPAILVTITRCDQLSTQAQTDEIYYQLNAWLVEDIETYRSQKTGYYALLSPDSPDAASCSLDDLLQKITDLLDCFFAEQRRICEHCQNYPEIHVFLPFELMHLGVDIWPLKLETSGRQKYLGREYVVVIRCANRYDGNYSKGPDWLKLWNRHQNLLEKPAHSAFVLGHDNDLDELMEVLEEAVQDSNVVGLQVGQKPLNVEELCYELLESGLPLAIWPRDNLADLSHAAQLSDLLAACCLKSLPNTVKAKRAETRKSRNKPDRHIGHHLSLLWDDPKLTPPKSA